jgi:hypothetical protein
MSEATGTEEELQNKNAYANCRPRAQQQQQIITFVTRSKNDFSQSRPRSEPSSPPVHQSGWMMTGCLVPVFFHWFLAVLSTLVSTVRGFSHGWKVERKEGLKRALARVWYEIGLH